MFRGKENKWKNSGNLSRCPMGGTGKKNFKLIQVVRPINAELMKGVD